MSLISLLNLIWELVKFALLKKQAKFLKETSVRRFAGDFRDYQKVTFDLEKDSENENGRAREPKRKQVRLQADASMPSAEAEQDPQSDQVQIWDGNS